MSSVGFASDARASGLFIISSGASPLFISKLILSKNLFFAVLLLINLF